MKERAIVAAALRQFDEVLLVFWRGVVEHGVHIPVGRMKGDQVVFLVGAGNGQYGGQEKDNVSLHDELV